jgi:3-oxoacyl-[acyl-carrier protein] reductase
MNGGDTDVVLGSYPDLAGQVVVVTGASGRIGQGTARAFAEAGARVAVTGRNPEALQEVVERLAAGGHEVLGVPADLSAEDDVARMHDTVLERLGVPYGVCAFAGGSGANHDVAAMPLGEWDAVITGNLTTTLLTMRAFLPDLASAGEGSVVTMASTAARRAGARSSAYAAAKLGVLALTRAAALEVADRGVRVNSVSPGAVLEGLAMPDDALARQVALHPLGRTGLRSDVASLALFLVSRASAWITGATIDVNGGREMV